MTFIFRNAVPKASSLMRSLQMVRNSNIRLWRIPSTISRHASQKTALTCMPVGRTMDSKGIILGSFLQKNDPKGESFSLTRTANQWMIDNQSTGNLTEIFKSPFAPKFGESRNVYTQNKPVVTLTGLGDNCYGFNKNNSLNERAENIRHCVSKGVAEIKKLGVEKIDIENFDSLESSEDDKKILAEAAAEGASLTLYHSNDLETVPKIELFDSCFGQEAWIIGLEKAKAQNMVRSLSDKSSNELSPKKFVHFTNEYFDGMCTILAQKDIRDQQLIGILNVSKTSCDEPRLIWAEYNGCDKPDAPTIAIVGTGITYNSGGLSNLEQTNVGIQNQISGAAIAVSTIQTAKALKLPINLTVVVPITEHMIGANALQPGEIIKMNDDKFVKVVNTSHAHSLLCADALNFLKRVYEKNPPKTIMTVGTFAGLNHGLGTQATPAYSNNESLMESLVQAGMHTGDRIWKTPEVPETDVAELKNSNVMSTSPVHGHSKFLNTTRFIREFLPKTSDWIHLDVKDVQYSDGDEIIYLKRGMTGRPVRTIIEFLSRLTCKRNSRN